MQYCDFDENNPKFPLYQYRAAVIHYRIGSLYHSHIWYASNDSANRKNITQLAKINYEKAAKLYFQSSDVVNYLTAQMQRLALLEFLVESEYFKKAIYYIISQKTACPEVIFKIYLYRNHYMAINVGCLVFVCYSNELIKLIKLNEYLYAIYKKINKHQICYYKYTEV